MNCQPQVRPLPFSTILKNEPLTETNLEQLELDKGRQGGLSDVFGQASNILKRQGGYLFIDRIRILSWIDEPQMIEFQNLRSSMQANLFTMKIRNVNPNFQHNYYEIYGTGTRSLSGVLGED